MNESDDDLLESSEDEEEEDDDDDHIVGSHQRMPEAGVPARDQSKDPLTSGSGVLPESNGGSEGGGPKGGKRHVPTRTSGARPSVASQMREMEGRPSQEDDPAIDDAARTGGSLKSNGEPGSSGDFIKEYMVRVGSCCRTPPAYR